MSLQALVWAFAQNITPSSIKFVLVAMADCANVQDGKIFPSVDFLCEKTSQDRKTIIDAIDTLEAIGYLIDTGDKTGKTAQIKIYKLNGFETFDDRICHYCYKLMAPNGDFYIGVRSSSFSIPQDDIYMGSGVWPNAMRRAGTKLIKEILCEFKTRPEAEVFERNTILQHVGDDKCKNSTHRKFKRKASHIANPSERVPDSVDKSPKSPIKASQKRDTELQLTSIELQARGLPVNKNVDKKWGDTTSRNPETTEGEVLPYDWCSYAEAKNIPDDQIYRSWDRFKAVSDSPWQRDRWQRWVDKEKVAGVRSDDHYAD